MPHGIRRLMRLQTGRRYGLVGLAGLGWMGRRLPLVRGPVGMAVGILAGLALNDLSLPKSRLRSFARRMIKTRLAARVIGFELDRPDHSKRERTDS